MTIQRRSVLIGLAATVAALGLPFAPASAAVGTSTFNGIVEHISTNNIKIYDPATKQTLSFLLVPHFDQVFAADGKTTYQMKNLHNGQYVKVYYDQKALGVRHADRILVLNNANMVKKQQKG